MRGHFVECLQTNLRYQQRLIVAALHDNEGGDREGQGTDGHRLLSAEPIDQKDCNNRARKFCERRPD